MIESTLDNFGPFLGMPLSHTSHGGGGGVESAIILGYADIAKSDCLTHKMMYLVSIESSIGNYNYFHRNL